MKVLVSGGGTAGHIYPALTVAERLAAEHDRVTFVGTPDGLEAQLVPEAGIAFRALKAKGFDRSRPLTLLTSSARIAASTATAWRWMGSERPDVVVGFGGYVSIPVGAAAVLRGVPLVLHEQNSVPGLANRVLSRWANAVGVTYEDSAPMLRHPERAVHTGNPVRPAVLEADATEGRRMLGVPDEALVLLVFGGSRGARHINTAILALRERLLEIERLHVVLITGRAEFEAVDTALRERDAYADGRFKAHAYLHEMGSAICAADLVVARAGATSIAELTALGAACVLVPYPYATDDHQTGNAKAMVEHGAALLFADSELDDKRFGDDLVDVLCDADRRASMAAASAALGRRDASARVARLARDAATHNVRASR